MRFSCEIYNTYRDNAYENYYIKTCWGIIDLYSCKVFTFYVN